MELVKIDALQFEPPQTHLDTLDEITGAAHVLGLGRTLAGNAALGRDHDARRIGRQGLADQALGNLRAVGVGCVDQGHAQFNSTAQDAASLGGIGRFAPRTFAHQAHGSVTQTVNGHIAADEKCAAGCC